MNNINKSVLLGILFISIGIVLVINNLGFIPWQVRYYILQWENILIIIGGYLLLSKENERAGAILLGVGLIFVMDDWFYVSFWDLWPIALVIIGLYIIRQRKATDDDVFDSEADSNVIEDTAIFGGGDHVFSSPAFRKGNITAIFGGSNIDLTTSTLSPDSAQIEVFYLFGGSKIRVPKDWNIEFRVTSIFGGLSDKRIVSAVNPDAKERLVIRGLVIFGGAEITN